MKTNQLTALIGLTSFGLGNSACLQKEPDTKSILSHIGKTTQSKNKINQITTNPETEAPNIEVQGKPSPQPRATTPPPKPPRKHLEQSTQSLETSDEEDLTPSTTIDKQEEPLTNEEEQSIKLTEDEEKEAEQETENDIQETLQSYESQEATLHRTMLKQSNQHTDNLLNVIAYKHPPSGRQKSIKKAGLVSIFFKTIGKSNTKKLQIYQEAHLANQKQIKIYRRKLNHSLIDLNTSNKKNPNKLIAKIQDLWLEIYKSHLIKKSIKKLEHIRDIKYGKLFKKGYKNMQKIAKAQSEMSKYR